MKDRVLALTGVNVVPMNAPGVLPNQTVVIRDGLIESMGPQVPIPGDAHIFESKGMYLLPGLADMHVHLWGPPDLALYLANGVTTVRNMSGSPFHLEMRGQVEQGEIDGPRIITTSPVIDGPGGDGEPFWPGTILFIDPEGAQALVGGLAAQAYEQIKVYHQLSSECLIALGESVAEAGLLMVGHCSDEMTFEQAIDAGMNCFEHLRGIGNGRLRGGAWPPRSVKTKGGVSGLLEKLKATADGLDVEAVKPLADRMASEAVRNCPTLVIHGSAMNDDEAAACPYFEYQPPGQLEAWRAHNRFLFNAAPEDEINSATGAYRAKMMEVVRILNESGAPLLLGTDPPNPFVFPGFSIHDELDALVASGLSVFEAIACGTVNAAKFMGESGLWGSVAPGARADLVLTKRNPIDDLSTLRKPKAVIAAGNLFKRDDLDELLKRRAQARRNESRLTPYGTLTVSRKICSMFHGDQGAYRRG